MSPLVGSKMMIDYDAALARVLAELKLASVRVEISCEGEFSEGWFFCYESESFMQTGESSEQLMGNCPTLVDKYTGSLCIWALLSTRMTRCRTT